MNFVLDTHTHTLASGHAYSTIREMAYAAGEKGLKLLGITEHAPKMPGSCHEFYFRNLRVADRSMCGVELLFGAELNILDSDGIVDLPDFVLQKLDITPDEADGYRENEMRFQKMVTGRRMSMPQLRELIGGAIIVPQKSLLAKEQGAENCKKTGVM